MGSVLEEILADFPGWRVWPWAGHWYARRLMSSPPVVLRAANLSVLRVEMALRAARR